MKDFFILKGLDKASFIFSKVGVNYPTLRNILRVKLLMDERRVPTVLNDTEGKEGNYSIRAKSPRFQSWDESPFFLK